MLNIVNDLFAFANKWIDDRRQKQHASFFQRNVFKTKWNWFFVNSIWLSDRDDFNLICVFLWQSIFSSMNYFFNQWNHMLAEFDATELRRSNSLRIRVFLHRSILNQYLFMKRNSFFIILTSSLSRPFDNTSIQRRETKRSRRSTNASDEINFFFQQADNFFARRKSFFSNFVSNSFIDAPRNRRRLTKVDKIVNILNHIRSFHWIVKKFLRVLHEHVNHHAFRRAHGQIFNFVYVNVASEKNFEEQFDSYRKNIIFRDINWNWTFKSLSRELKFSIRQSMFEPFKFSSSINEFESLQSLKSKIQALQQQASLWMNFFEKITNVDDEKNEDENENESILQNVWSILILIVFCNRRRFYRAINLQTVLNFYLYQDKARIKIFNTFNRLNVVMAYKILQRRFKKFMFEISRRIVAHNQESFTVVTYDNFDFMKNKRGKRIDNTRV